MIYIVDVGREETLIHVIDLENGKYLMPKRVHGNFKEQTQQIINLVEIFKPEQIIFDEMGVGRGVVDMFPIEMKALRAYFTMDDTGRLTHF